MYIVQYSNVRHKYIVEETVVRIYSYLSSAVFRRASATLAPTHPHYEWASKILYIEYCRVQGTFYL